MLKSIYKSVIDSLNSYIVVIDSDGSIVVTNKVWDELIANLAVVKKIELSGSNYLDNFCAIQENSSDFLVQYKQHIDSLFSNFQEQFTFEFASAMLNDKIWLSVSASTMTFENKKLVILNHRNIIERKNSLVQIDKLTMTDQVTNLANRKSFNMFFENEWHRAKRENKKLTLLIGELSEPLLSEQQQKLSADIFAQFARRACDFSAVLKSNQFAVLLAQLKPGNCKAIAEKILQEIADLELTSPTNKAITVNIGISDATPTLVDTSDMLLNSVLLALESSKNSLDTNITSYCPTIVYKDTSLEKIQHQ